MRLSTVLELLLIALLVAFAASRVIDAPDSSRTLLHRFSARKDRQESVVPDTPVNAVMPVTQVVTDAEVLSGASGPTKICSCSSLTCNCCRDFALPVVPVKGPGCATVTYLHDNAMMLTMSFGDRVLRNITVNSKKPKPICMGMPGGISKFCGRLYSIKKDGDHFKACLGLELRALGDVEAAVRVSCFRFGPGGVNVEPGESFPVQKVKEKEEEEEDEDDDDYGLGAFSDDDDDDDDFGLTGGEDDDEEDDEKPAQKKDTTYNDVDSSDSDSDYITAMSDELFGGFFGSSKKKPIVSYDDDDDDDDDDEDDEYSDDTYIPDPPKSQLQPQYYPQAPPPSPQVNLVVMHPVIVPAQALVTSKPAVQRRPDNKPARTTSPRPIKKTKVTTVATTKATTSAPVKKTKPTLSPVRTVGTTTKAPVVPVIEVEPPKSTAAPIAEATTPKAPVKKRKKKPSQRRRPTTSKPAAPTSEIYPTVVTATTMTVNVVQGGTNLNQTKPQPIQAPSIDNQVKVAMSKPVVESKPVEPVKQLDAPLMTSTSESSVGSTAPIEYTTQPILHNTIPVDESIEDKQRPMAEELTMKRPTESQNYGVAVEDLSVNTTPNVEKLTEETTNQDTTVQDFLSYTHTVLTDNENNNYEKATTTMDSETTESNSEFKDEMTNESEPSIAVQTTIVDYNPATETYNGMSEATDKTETIVGNSDTQKNEDSSKDDDEDEEDDDDIDIGADLGLSDDDEESNENLQETKVKPETNDDDDDDVFGDILEDDEDEDDKSKEGEERSLGGSRTGYKINPLLYRLARVSSGSMATARHLPRFSSDGRNRRNNKRMRFPSIEVVS